MAAGLPDCTRTYTACTQAPELGFAVSVAFGKKLPQLPPD